MLRLLDEGADQVVGVRVGHVPPLRRFVKRLITRFAGALARQPIADLNSGLRCFQRDLVGPTLGLCPGRLLVHHHADHGRPAGRVGDEVVPRCLRCRTGASKFKPVRDHAPSPRVPAPAVVYFAPLRVFVRSPWAWGCRRLPFAVWDVVWEHNLTDKTVLLSLSPS